LKIQWSVLALTDRREIFDYIETDSPRAAVAVDDRIRSQVQALARFPNSGRIGRVDGTRELVIHGTPYVAAYRVVAGTVRILRVIHGAQRWPVGLA
jgi:toxin ParE1/3/4